MTLTTHPGNERHHPMTDHTNPTVEQFLASTEPDEEDTDHRARADVGKLAEAFSAAPGTIWTLPPDPMERIASALEAIAGRGASKTVSYDDMSVTQPVDYAVAEEALQLTREQLADADDQIKAMGDVISNIEAALGKSKAAPALAAKAVIDEWRNPQVPPAEDEGLTGTEGLDNALRTYPTPAVGEPSPMNAALSIPGHTRAETGENTPDICQECSYAAQDYVVWPCDVAGGVVVQSLTGPEEGHEPVQPEHNAPVEEWRAYARALGYAGPEIDKANRSVIRTTLGIAQPVSDQTAGA